VKDYNYMNLAQTAGEIWGTLARATFNQPVLPPTAGVQPNRVLGHDVYFVILDKLKEDFKKEVPVETEAVDGEDA
jgi:hypothetical protein